MSATNTKGKVAESRIIHECTKHGVKVAVPFCGDSSYDLIVDKHGKLMRVQVKCAESDQQVLWVKLQRTYKTSKRTVYRNYTKDDFDWLAVYDLRADRCYFIPVELCANKGSLNLRLTPTKSGQVKNVIFAKDFELTAMLNSDKM